MGKAGEFMLPIAERLLEALKACGARAVFGIPGDYALPLFETFERSRLLPLHTLSHEPAVAFAADGAARAAGGIGVAAATYGAGALNLLNGVAGAYAERSPLCVISAAPPRMRPLPGLLPHHQVRTADSQLRIFREVTCAQAVLDDVEQAPGEIARVLDACKRHSLPVYFEIPSDMALAPCAKAGHAANADDLGAAAECAAEIATLVRSAKRPVLMIGVEVRRFGLEAEVADLARRAGVPVVTSFMGRGVAASAGLDHAGCYMGLAGDPAVTQLVEDSDALVLLGVILCDTNLGVQAHRLDLRRVVHAFGGDVRIGHHTYPNVSLGSLVRELFRLAPSDQSRAAPATAKDIATPFVPDEARIAPSDVSAAINALFADRAFPPIVCDTGDSLFVSIDLAAQELLAQGYYASMGFAVPAAMGAQVVSGQRPLVLVGDGAFQMTGWELGNCRRWGIDPVVIVLNNRSWGMLKLFSPSSRFNDLDDWHFAVAADAFGGEGVRVTTRRELFGALARAWRTRGRFQLIEAVLADGASSEALGRFVRALRRPGAKVPHEVAMA
ncbi:MAG TPA: indolepyruvate/phenylpyruvate decarboxylase [Rhizomicrobium sp.]|nr:indolepyruvate/phenylpyruvate decarboxylase [Rhizomicrobium sp.]